MSEEEITLSCYNCKHIDVCGINLEMGVIDTKYGNKIEGLYSILAENCKEFDERE